MDTESWDIAIRVLSGEASLEDKKKLIMSLGQDPEKMKAFGQAESIWNALEIMASGKEYDSQEAFKKFQEKTYEEIPGKRFVKLQKAIDWGLRIAAMAIIVAGISFFMLKKERIEKISDTSMCEVISPRGSKVQLLLPDGTRVWLNAESKIRYRKNFNERSRDIYLEGEGYFEVARNPAKPFVVSTADIRIKALGTSFNIKSYPGENTIETTLIEGKVLLEKVSANGQVENPMALTPNQKVIYYKKPDTTLKSGKVTSDNSPQRISPKKSFESQVILNKNVNSDQAIAWKDNRLYFENESFENLAVKLERRFGVDIHFLNEDIKQYPFSGRFDDIIIEQVLVALQFASPFYYTFSDKDIYISNKPIKDVPKRKSNIKIRKRN
jgi:transmembrane sensor